MRHCDQSSHNCKTKTARYWLTMTNAMFQIKHPWGQARRSQELPTDSVMTLKLDFLNWFSGCFLFDQFKPTMNQTSFAAFGLLLLALVIGYLVNWEKRNTEKKFPFSPFSLLYTACNTSRKLVLPKLVKAYFIDS